MDSLTKNRILAAWALLAGLMVGGPFFGPPCLAGPAEGKGIPRELRDGAFPVYPGAVKDFRQSGATSLQPGKNYSVSIYTVEAPLAEVLRFYQARLEGCRQLEDPDGSVKLMTDGGSVRLMKSGPLTKIQMTQGPN